MNTYSLTLHTCQRTYSYSFREYVQAHETMSLAWDLSFEEAVKGGEELIGCEGICGYEVRSYTQGDNEKAYVTIPCPCTYEPPIDRTYKKDRGYGDMIPRGGSEADPNTYYYECEQRNHLPY